MTQEDKQLLLKDLCARLSYKIRVAVVEIDGEILKKPVFLLRGGWFEEYHNGEYMFITSYYGAAHKAEEIRPYLRPISSMTEEEKEEYCKLQDEVLYSSGRLVTDNINDMVDWLNAHYFDYHGLIEKGLALEATKNIYKLEK